MTIKLCTYFILQFALRHTHCILKLLHAYCKCPFLYKKISLRKSAAHWNQHFLLLLIRNRISYSRQNKTIEKIDTQKKKYFEKWIVRGVLCGVLFFVKLTFLVIFFKKLKTADWLTNWLSNFWSNFLICRPVQVRFLFNF